MSISRSIICLCMPNGRACPSRAFSSASDDREWHFSLFPIEILFYAACVVLAWFALNFAEQ